MTERSPRGGFITGKPYGELPRVSNSRGESMTDEPARQLLRDYARETGDCARLAPNENGETRIYAATRGEMAGKVFMALQAVLELATAADEEHGPISSMVLTGDLRAAITKALES
jgi:hypothetical protein